MKEDQTMKSVYYALEHLVLSYGIITPETFFKQNI